MRKDYYATLGVNQDATPEDLKKSFRRLARETHPDANPDDPTAEARFREIAEAYEVLSDPEKRRAYDRGDTLDFGDLFGGFGVEDLLRSVFGDSGLFGTMGRTSRRRGRDVFVPVSISLAEAAFGTTSKVAFRGQVICSTCSGTGAAEGTHPATCDQCAGMGSVRVSRRTVLGTMMSVVECDRCKGKGQVVTNPCFDCHGDGTRSEQREALIEIPTGVSDGSRLRLSGQGEASGLGGPAGDLYVEVRVEHDERFERAGDDLVHRVSVGIAQAALGVSLSVPTIDGDDLDLDIPSGTQPGTVIAVPNRGMARLGRRGRGRMLVEVTVAVPADLSAQAAEALRAFAEANSESVDPPRRWRRAK
ncbi:MAG: J domain-containing protein [Acidimicrobiia bacterium]|nr:J domain-containing protein [Acidimicrobiia bacterium]